MVRWTAHLEHQLVQLCHEWSHLLGRLPQAYNQPQLPTLSWLAGASYRGEGTPPASVTALARMRLEDYH